MHTSHNQALSRGATPRESTGLFNARERNLDLSAERALAKSLASLPVCCVCHKRIPANVGYAVLPSAAAAPLPLPSANRQPPTANATKSLFICDLCLDQPVPDPPAAALTPLELFREGKGPWPGPILPSTPRASGLTPRASTLNTQHPTPLPLSGRTPLFHQTDVDQFTLAGYIDEDDEQREAILLEQEFFMDQRYLEGQQVAEILEDYVGDMSIQEAA